MELAAWIVALVMLAAAAVALTFCIWLLIDLAREYAGRWYL